MKKLLSTIALAVLPIMMMAQARIAVVNSQQIFDQMPQKAAAEAQLKALSDQYQAEYQLLQGEFDKKYADYQAVVADANTPAAIKERRMQEVQEGDKKIQEFERRAADDIARQRADLTKPITDKIQDAIRTVGDQGGYDLIIDTAVTRVAYTGGRTIDVTPQVKSILGLE